MNQWDKFKQSLPKISTKDITTNYNDGRIIGAKDLLTLAKIYPKKCKNLIVMFTKRKTKPDQPPKWFRDFEMKIFLWIDKQEKFNKEILERLDYIELRLDNLVAKNHLTE